VAIQLAFRADGAVLCIEMGGRWLAPDMHGAIGSVHTRADQDGISLLLVDSRKLSPPDSDVTRYFAGVRWAELFPARFRTAFVVMPELYNGFAELVARNRGASVSVFFDEGPARTWLLDAGRT
jgi:hypothetical protein